MRNLEGQKQKIQERYGLFLKQAGDAGTVKWVAKNIHTTHRARALSPGRALKRPSRWAIKPMNEPNPQRNNSDGPRRIKSPPAAVETSPDPEAGEVNIRDMQGAVSVELLSGDIRAVRIERNGVSIRFPIEAARELVADLQSAIEEHQLGTDTES